MFKTVTLFQSHEISSMVFEPEKTYLLMVAQGCDVTHIPSAPFAANIYTITSPAIIWKTTLHDNALLCCELSSTSHIIFCRHEKDASPDMLLNSRTIMMFVHWLDPKIYRYIDKLFSLTPEEVTIMGVGCGRTDSVNTPIMTCNHQTLTDGFLVIFSPETSLVGSAHSSEFHSGYYIAQTEASNRITTINGEEAFGFYQKMVQQNFHEYITPETIFDTGLKYPLGLGGINGEQALRVPVDVDQGALIVAGPMESEVTICFMHSTQKTLLNAASKAVYAAKLNAHSLSQKECFVIECMGRHALLGTAFEQELDTIAHTMQGVTNMYGVLSLGEIANSAEKYIEYFNESCVIGVLNANQ